MNQSLRSIIVFGLVFFSAFVGLVSPQLSFASSGECQPVIVFGPVSSQGRDMNRAPSVLVVFREMEEISLVEQVQLKKSHMEDLAADFSDHEHLYRTHVISKSAFEHKQFELKKAKLDYATSKNQLMKTRVRLKFNQKAAGLENREDLVQLQKEFSKRYWSIYSSELRSQRDLLSLSKSFIDNEIEDLSVLAKRNVEPMVKLRSLKRKSRDLEVRLNAVVQRINVVDQSGCSSRS